MKKISTLKKLFGSLAICSAVTFNSNAQLLNEGFDDITTLPAANWNFQNLSNPLGTEDWVQGYSPNANQTYIYIANSGSDSSFISADFLNGSNVATLSNWLITPPLTINNGDTLAFFTRSTDLGGTVYPDRMQVWLNQTNTTNVGVDEFSTGDFTDMLLDINDMYTATGYPFVWTQYVLPISGIVGGPVTGRIAFRYFVENGGPSGDNSFIASIDDVVYTSGTTGINELNAQNASVSLSPNPASDNLLISFNEPTKANLSLKIINDKGQLVYSGNIKNGTGQENIDVTKFAQGTYTALIRNANTYVRKPFIKN